MTATLLTDAANCQTLCKTHNRAKGNRQIAARKSIR